MMTPHVTSGWEEEFGPEWDVPPVIEHALEDLSDKADQCPSFADWRTVHHRARAPRLYVDHPARERRACYDSRFTIVIGSHGEGAIVVWEGDEPIAAVIMTQVLSDEVLANAEDAVAWVVVAWHPEQEVGTARLVVARDAAAARLRSPGFDIVTFQLAGAAHAATQVFIEAAANLVDVGAHLVAAVVGELHGRDSWPENPHPLEVAWAERLITFAKGAL